MHEAGVHVKDPSLLQIVAADPVKGQITYRFPSDEKELTCPLDASGDIAITREKVERDIERVQERNNMPFR